MDEVPLSFDIPPTRTVDVQGARLFTAKTAADYTPVSIRMKARVIAREMNIVNFSGGPTWCYRFMKRNNLVVQRSDRNYLMTGKNNLTTF
ncbi:hypothetical protein TNCV_1925551 [Trichonephila clavipes]|nr:hypothetical protein TNCV_1925551 [Trichonephila clavipes]